MSPSAAVATRPCSCTRAHAHHAQTQVQTIAAPPQCRESRTCRHRPPAVGRCGPWGHQWAHHPPLALRCPHSTQAALARVCCGSLRATRPPALTSCTRRRTRRRPPHTSLKPSQLWATRGTARTTCRSSSPPAQSRSSRVVGRRASGAHPAGRWGQCRSGAARVPAQMLASNRSSGRRRLRSTMTLFERRRPVPVMQHATY